MKVLERIPSFYLQKMGHIRSSSSAIMAAIGYRRPNLAVPTYMLCTIEGRMLAKFTVYIR